MTPLLTIINLKLILLSHLSEQGQDPLLGSKNGSHRFLYQVKCPLHRQISSLCQIKRLKKHILCLISTIFFPHRLKRTSNTRRNNLYVKRYCTWSSYIKRPTVNVRISWYYFNSMIFSLQVSSDNEIQNIMANETKIHEPNFAQANIR